MGYGPKMTPKQRIKLLKEIAGFNKERTLREIEKSASGGKDVDAYAAYVKQNGGVERTEANPDTLSENCQQPWAETSRLDLVGLSKSEKDAWELCEEMSLTQKDAAEEMGVSIGTVKKLLFRARMKLRGQL